MNRSPLGLAALCRLTVADAVRAAGESSLMRRYDSDRQPLSDDASYTFPHEVSA